MNAIVHDNLFPSGLVRAANLTWPAADWKGWVRYDPSYECKRASDLMAPLPSPAGLLLARMAAVPVAEWFPSWPALVPDLSLWGAGLHEMPTGPGLARHLDADTHARLGLRRVLTAVLWVHDEWLPEWGGELQLGAGLAIVPAPGRLAVFACGEEWHEVRPVCCPPGASRRSLALFWYAASPGFGGRPRALFAGHEQR